VTTIVRARAASTPAPADIEFAQQVTDLMLNELVAALFKEFADTHAGKRGAWQAGDLADLQRPEPEHAADWQVRAAARRRERPSDRGL
jgi:hypothetical protein